MIQAVIFDIGGVLTRTVDPGPRRRREGGGEQVDGERVWSKSAAS